MQKKYAKMIYSSPIGSLSLVADDHYLYGIWVQEQKHFERGLGDETIEAVVSHPILDPVIACLDVYFKASLRIYPTCPWLQSERILKSEFGLIYREFLMVRQ